MASRPGRKTPAKNARRAKKAPAPAIKGKRRNFKSLRVPTISGDNFSFAVDDLVPAERRGSKQYLDVVQWNLEWFGAAGPHEEFTRKRLPIILDIFEALNGDLFILQEIAGPTQDGRRKGALDEVADTLTRRGAGAYVVDYTKAGGQQRVAMMWDTQVLKARDNVEELFKQGEYKMADGKDPFARRTPLYGYFKGRPVEADGSLGSQGYFEFQTLGVHLKAMADGAAQREESAKILSDWMRVEAPLIDADVMIMGDFNAPPGDPCWAPFHALEDQDKAKFQSINDPTDFSYLWLDNATSRAVSKIDLAVLSLASAENVVGEAATAVRWKPIDEALKDSGTLSDKKVREIMKILKNELGDHLPCATRFFFREGQG